MASDEIQSRIEEKYHEMSPQLQRLAAFILEDSQEAAFLNTAQLSKRVGVSKATVVRFAAALGFASFGDLQQSMARGLQKRLSLLDRIPSDFAEGTSMFYRFLRQDITNMEGTLSDRNAQAFETAVRIAGSARRLLTIGGGAPFSLAFATWAYLSQILSNVVLISGSGENFIEEMGLVGPGDVVIAYSFQRYNRRTLQVLEYAHARGAQYILITDSVSSPASARASALLICDVKSVSFTESLGAPLATGLALVSALAALNPAATRARLAEWDRALQHFGVRANLLFEK